VLLANACAALREIPAAIEHIEKHVARSRRQGISPEGTDAIEQWGQELKQRLVANYLNISRLPKPPP